MVLPKVTIEQGTLRGSTATDIRRNAFLKFQGIPYAKPPLGELRFKAPVFPENYTGVLDATKESEACYQKDIFKNKDHFGSEDCLYLNVYTKKLPKNTKDLQPVMFWIHGGGFVAGSGSENLYGPEFLITQGVVLVTINYRLGLLGFINFDDPTLEVPGNAGLKDQVMALKWVQKNVSAFGGDPNNVTIFGEGAGGASVHLLVLSPLAKGLFHKAIAQSGCALNPWVRGTKGIKRIAAAIDLAGSDEKTIYDALMEKTVEELVAIQEKIVDNLDGSEVRPFGLVLEKNSKEPFLDEEPFVVIGSGQFTQVPFIIGYTLNETGYSKIFKTFELENFEKTIPGQFGYKYGSSEAEAVVKKISNFYFDNEKGSGKIEKFDLWSDCHFIYGIYLTATTQAKVSKNPLFLYRVTVKTDLNLFKSSEVKKPGMFHSNDVQHLFENFATPKIRRGSLEDISVSRFVKLWTNFAYYGNPTPEDTSDVLNIVWKPVTGANLDFLDIGHHLVPMTNPDDERINFWKKLFDESPAGQKLKAPVPAEPWSGILDATKEGEVCYHRDPLKPVPPFGGENCLFLNVFTKKLPEDGSKDLRPVLFWVHGGGFFFGSGNEDLYGPDFLITEDVVVVTINYRLGMLGFLSFEDPSLEIPGNTGLKDQVMALKWVQQNISKFGGDPNNVTIFGESAGGASIHLLVLSPMTKGLFHKAIAQSGCALNPWARGSRGCKRLAPAMGLEGADERTIYNTLMKKSAEEIFQIQEKMQKVLVINEPGALGFVVEKNSSEAFLDDEPMTLMSTGRFNQVPFMLGFTTGEGMFFDLFFKQFPDIKQIIPWYFEYQTDSPELNAAADKLKKFYFGDEDISPKTASKKYDILSDCHFIYGIYTTIITQISVSKAPTYLYRVSVESELNFMKKILKIELPGVCHLDDVGYLFKNFVTPEVKPGSVEDIGLSRFVKLWTNFARFGNPTPDRKDTLVKTAWKPVTNENLDFLDIGKELIAMTKPYPERINFWRQLFAESPAGQQTSCCHLKTK